MWLVCMYTTNLLVSFEVPSLAKSLALVSAQGRRMTLSVIVDPQSMLV